MTYDNSKELLALEAEGKIELSTISNRRKDQSWFWTIFVVIIGLISGWLSFAFSETGQINLIHQIYWTTGVCFEAGCIIIRYLLMKYRFYKAAAVFTLIFISIPGGVLTFMIEDSISIIRYKDKAYTEKAILNCRNKLGNSSEAEKKVDEILRRVYPTAMITPENKEEYYNVAKDIYEYLYNRGIISNEDYQKYMAFIGGMGVIEHKNSVWVKPTMTKEKLDQLLALGEISQKDYDLMVKLLEENK